MNIFGKCTANERALIARFYAATLISDHSLEHTITVSGQKVKSTIVRSVLNQIMEDIKKTPLLSSIINREKLLGSLFINICRFNSSPGTLSKRLILLAEYYETQATFTGSLKRTIRPSLIVLLGALFALFCVIVFIAPEMAAKSIKSGVHIPSATAIALSIELFFEKTIFISSFTIPLALILLGYGIILLYKYPPFERFVWNLPLLGTIVRCSHLESFFSTLSLTLTAGISLIDSLSLSANESKSRSIRQVIDRTTQAETKSLAMVLGNLEKDQILPPFLKDSIHEAETLADTIETLKKIAVFYRESILTQVSPVVIIIQPLIVLCFGFMAFTILIALSLPFLK
jgi:type II secretory pathway component PulF